MLYGCSTVDIAWPNAFAAFSCPIPCDAVHWSHGEFGKIEHKSLYLASKPDTAEDFNTRLDLCVRVLSVKGIALVWPYVCYMSQTFQIHSPRVQQYISICCQHSVAASPSVWQPGTISGVVDRYFGMTAGLWYLFHPYSTLIQQSWNFLTQSSSLSVW